MIFRCRIYQPTLYNHCLKVCLFCLAFFLETTNVYQNFSSWNIFTISLSYLIVTGDFFLLLFFFKYLISLLVETTTDEFHTRLQCSVFAAISKEVNSRVPALPALLAPKYLGKHSRNYENIMYFHPTFDVEAGKNCQLAERLTRTFAYASNEQFHFIRPRGLPQLR